MKTSGMPGLGLHLPDSGDHQQHEGGCGYHPGDVAGLEDSGVRAQRIQEAQNLWLTSYQMFRFSVIESPPVAPVPLYGTLTT